MKTRQYETVGEAIDARKEHFRSLQEAHLEGANTRKHRNVRHAHKPFEPLDPEEFAAKYHKRCHRFGKTDRERRAHAASNRFKNRESRSEYTRWCSDHGSHLASTAAAVAKFSELCGSCNGKRTRALKRA
jgi:hypothetical protein